MFTPFLGNKTKYALVVVKSKPLALHLRENKLLYEPEVAQAAYDAATVLRDLLGSPCVYLNVSQAYALVARGTGSPINQRWNVPKFASIAASAWAGVINQRIRSGQILTAQADVLFTNQADIVVSTISSAAKNNEQAGLDLAVRKLSTRADSGSGLTKPAKHELLAARGQQLENIPHIYRRGICLCRSEQTQAIESIIDMEPEQFFRAVLNRLEAKAA